MRTLFSCFLILLLTLGLATSEAYAKRFGGGRSFGVQRSQSSFFSPKQHSNSSAYTQRPGANKWGGVLGGMLVGGLLASLFMGHGLANGLISWLLVGGVALFLFNLWKRKMQPGFQAAPAGNFKAFFDNQATNPFTTQNDYQPSSSPAAYPAGFSAEAFLREAKIKFIRLQAAYDQKNLQDLRDFTAPEVFGEIKMQLDERGDALNTTEVLGLNAELLDVSNQVDSYIASVRFTGRIIEDNNPPASFDEIWHFRQFSPRGEWVVGGIQQA